MYAKPRVLPVIAIITIFAASAKAKKPEPAPTCQVTICLAGAFTREDGGNPRFENICKDLPGILTDCDGKRCYPMFSMNGTSYAHKRLLAALDTNQDRKIDSRDQACTIALVGYSWGGINAIKLANLFLADSRVAPQRRKIDRVVVVAPYAPLVAVKVKQGIKSFWEYRHSQTPTRDCSQSGLMGPYLGRVPTCHKSVVCKDYDYSLAPETQFDRYLGREIGHCKILSAAKKAVTHNITTGTDYPQAIPQVPVKTF